MDKFIFSDTGLKMTFGEYRMWYQNINNYISVVDGITGRVGWVGNFALSTDGKKVTGIGLGGASAIQWGRQYNTGVWLLHTQQLQDGLDLILMADRYSGTDFPPYMVQIQTSTSIESHLGGSNTTLRLDSGTNTVYPINHTNLRIW